MKQKHITCLQNQAVWPGKVSRAGKQAPSTKPTIGIGHPHIEVDRHKRGTLFKKPVNRVFEAVSSHSKCRVVL